MKLSPGDIVRFHFLHLNKATLLEPRPNGEEEIIYRVPGKKRPVLIISCQGEEWYIVLYLTGKDKKGSRFHFPRSIGPIGALCKESWVETSQVYKYPKSLAVKQLAKLPPELLDIIKTHLRQANGYSPPTTRIPEQKEYFRKPVVDGDADA